MAKMWSAGPDVVALFSAVKEKHHHPRLQNAKIAIAFADNKAFVKNRFNFGKVSCFSSRHKLWHAKNQTYDFEIVLSMDAWQEVLNSDQREAWADLLLTCCSVQYEPEVIEENGKKKVLKDDWGRVKYTTTPKFDDLGNPKWKVVPLDLNVFAENVARYGIWCETILTFRDVIVKQPEPSGCLRTEPADGWENWTEPTFDKSDSIAAILQMGDEVTEE